MELIRNWLNGQRNYRTGLQLYLAYGTNESLKLYLQADFTPYREQRLAEELLALVAMPDAPAISDEDPALNPAFAPPPNLMSDDPVIEEFYRQKSTLHKEKDMLRHSLESFETDEERGIAAHRIISIRKQLTLIWNREQYYAKFKRLPVDNEDAITDPKALKYRLSQVKSNLRRLKSQLKKDPQNESFSQSYEKFLREDKDLQEKIKKYKAVLT